MFSLKLTDKAPYFQTSFVITEFNGSVTDYPFSLKLGKVLDIIDLHMPVGKFAKKIFPAFVYSASELTMVNSKF